MKVRLNRQNAYSIFVVVVVVVVVVVFLGGADGMEGRKTDDLKLIILILINPFFCI